MMRVVGRASMLLLAAAVLLCHDVPVVSASRSLAAVRTASDGSVSIEAINQEDSGRAVLSDSGVRSMQRFADSQGGSTVHRFDVDEVARRAVETMPRNIPGLVSAELIIPEQERQTRAQHGSTIAEVAPGEFVAAWFGGTWERMGDVGIWSARYVNGSWGAATQVVVPEPDGRYPVHAPCWNPVLLHIPERFTTLLFYKMGVDTKVWRGYIRMSVDGGRTWSDARQMGRGLVGPTKSAPLILEDGTMLSGSSDENGEGTVHVEVSRDFGWTWDRQDDIGYRSGIIQPAIFRTLDGNLHMLMRSRRDGVVSTYSRDDGQSWRSPQGGRIDAPSAGLSAITLADGRVLVVHNGRGREELQVSLSDDDGESYDVAATLELERDRFRGPSECDADGRQEAEFSYPSAIQSSDGLVHITYTYSYYGSGDRCFGRENVKHMVLDPCELGRPDRAPRPCESSRTDFLAARLQRILAGNDGDEPADIESVSQSGTEDGAGCQPSESARDMFSPRSRGVRRWGRSYSTLEFCFQRCDPQDGYTFIVENSSTGDCFCYLSADSGSSAARWGYRWPDTDGNRNDSDVDEGQLVVYDLSQC
eukprot:jgi/Tetstr1/439246/TSEL_027688.t1